MRRIATFLARTLKRRRLTSIDGDNSLNKDLASSSYKLSSTHVEVLAKKVGSFSTKSITETSVEAVGKTDVETTQKTGDDTIAGARVDRVGVRMDEDPNEEWLRRGKWIAFYDGSFAPHLMSNTACGTALTEKVCARH